VKLIAGQALVVLGLGLASGLIASAILTRVIASQLFGVGAADPLTFVLVPVLLLLVAAVATIGPARRAARQDPLQVLRGS
jgi:ABC-type lipoprotein release transport system permease subunit